MRVSIRILNNVLANCSISRTSAPPLLKGISFCKLTLVLVISSHHVLPFKDAQTFLYRTTVTRYKNQLPLLVFRQPNSVAAHEVNVKGTLYKKKMCVILEKNDEELVFGRIKLILIHNATAVYFITEKFQSVCLVDQGVYCLTDITNNVCADHTSLLDYYHLPEYNMLSLPEISLHHSFPFL